MTSKTRAIVLLNVLATSLALAQPPANPSHIPDETGAKEEERTEAPVQPAVNFVGCAKPPNDEQGPTLGENAEKAMLSVVSIETESEVPRLGSMDPHDRKISTSQGSGFVFDEEGLVATNAHVVGGSNSIKLSFRDGRVYSARIVGMDEEKDIAVLQIERPDRKFPPLALGSSSQAKLLDTVVTLGNPLGYGHTATCGKISFIGRDVQAGSEKKRVQYDRALQVDAPINPGNSGGPLINTHGEVIGINSAVATGASGIGFAIPIDDARAILGHLINDREKKGSINHGLQWDEKDKGTHSLHVASVEKGSLAERAGLRKNDIIRRAGKVAVQDSADFERGLYRTSGKSLPLIVERGQDELKIDLPIKRIGEPSTPSEVLGSFAQSEMTSIDPVAVSAITRKKTNRAGYLVISAEKNSGLREADILLAVELNEKRYYLNDDKAVQDFFAVQVRKIGAKAYYIVWRDGKVMTIPR